MSLFYLKSGDLAEMRRMFGVTESDVVSPPDSFFASLITGGAVLQRLL